MQKTFPSYSDPQHGWAKVPRSLLVELNILSEITSCSYQRGQFVYLEEDCDLGTFIKAYEAATGSKPSFKSSWTNNQSRIRGYDNFSPKAVPVDPKALEAGHEVKVYGNVYTLLIRRSSTTWVVENNEGKRYTCKTHQMTAITA